MATSGPTEAATLVTSIARFTSVFGSPDASLERPWLAPSIAAFFENSGRRCYVVRVLSPTAPAVEDALAALEDVSEVSAVAAPGLTSAAIQNALIAHCERLGDRVAILDSVGGADRDAVLEQRARVSSSDGFAALYYPWLVTPSEDGRDSVLPPSGFVAGAWARTDLAVGVWRSPAGMENGLLRGVNDVERTLGNDEQDDLNEAGVNVIRHFAGVGVRVWGARTVASNSEWRYVPVRRTALWIEASIYRGTDWVVFEPNDEPLWATLRLRIGAFLQGLFRDGAFQGARPSDAYLVQVDRGTMSQNDLDNGRTISLVGLALVRPAEFTLLHVVHERGRLAFVRGETNGDGQVDVSDAIGVLEWLFLGGPAPECLAAADVNGDGGIDLSDASSILSFLFLGGSAPVAPFPDCGDSGRESDDDLGCQSPPAACA